MRSSVARCDSVDMSRKVGERRVGAGSGGARRLSIRAPAIRGGGRSNSGSAWRSASPAPGAHTRDEGDRWEGGARETHADDVPRDVAASARRRARLRSEKKFSDARRASADLPRTEISARRGRTADVAAAPPALRTCPRRPRLHARVRRSCPRGQARPAAGRGRRGCPRGQAKQRARRSSQESGALRRGRPRRGLSRRRRRARRRSGSGGRCPCGSGGRSSAPCRSASGPPRTPHWPRRASAAWCSGAGCA